MAAKNLKMREKGSVAEREGLGREEWRGMEMERKNFKWRFSSLGDLWGPIKSQKRPKRDQMSSIHGGQVHKASKKQHI